MNDTAIIVLKTKHGGCFSYSVRVLYRQAVDMITDNCPEGLRWNPDNVRSLFGSFGTSSIYRKNQAVNRVRNLAKQYNLSAENDVIWVNDFDDYSLPDSLPHKKTTQRHKVSVTIDFEVKTRIDTDIYDLVEGMSIQLEGDNVRVEDLSIGNCVIKLMDYY